MEHLNRAATAPVGHSVLEVRTRTWPQEREPPPNAQSKAFVYSPLPKRAGQAAIRIIELLPLTGSATTGVQCKILTQYLDLCDTTATAVDGDTTSIGPATSQGTLPQVGWNDYEALSYCWGESQARVPIWIDGFKFEVTRNLEQAMFLLAEKLSDEVASYARGVPQRRRYLWIDAICINQDDEVEKADQVQHMNRIFRRADKVIVWLGEENFWKTHNASHEMLRIINEDVTKLGDSRRAIRRERTNWRNRLTAKLKSEALEAEVLAFKFLLSRPWFRRAWIVQEFAVSNSTLVMYGHGTVIKWEEVVQAARVFLRPEMRIFDVDRESLYAPLQLDEIRRSFHSRRALPLTDLLHSFRGVQASDARDIIYSLVGIASDVRELGIVPCYKQEVTPIDVFLSSARQILRADKTLSFLQIPRLEMPRDARVLPSWVPEWRLRCNMDPLPYRHVAFAASKDAATWFDIDRSHRLYLRGMLISNLTELSESWPELTAMTREPDSLGTAIHAIDRLQRFALKSKVRRYRTGERPTDVFFKTILAGLGTIDYRAKRRAFLSWNHALREALRKLKPDGENPGEWNRSADQIDAIWDKLMVPGVAKVFDHLHICHGRKLAWCSNHALSLVPSHAKPGDMLFIPAGGRTPLAIRSLGGGMYSLVGAVYTHGYMFGEEWSDKSHTTIALL